MPLYEFRCESCGHEVETIMAFSDPLPTVCEACGGALKKLLSAPAVQFKGSGFYLTDYGRSGSDAKGKESPSAGPGGKSSGDSPSSGDSKSAGGTKASGDSKSPGEAKGAGGAPAATGGDAKPRG
jgi:putative FmdB family regulatory protein